MNNKIGLFGTCDSSKWREPFIEKFNSAGIDWYNPDVADWEPWMAEEENKNLQEDSIILFPVLAESLGLGSLAEIGFSVLDVVRAIVNGRDQTLIVLIDDECTDDRKTENERKTSNRTRRLVKSKLEKIKHPNIYLVNTLDQMMSVAIHMYNINITKAAIQFELTTKVA